MRRPGKWLLAGIAGAVIVGGAGLSVWAAEYNQAREKRRWAAELTGGNSEAAETHILRYGCAGCHTIPGVRGPEGLVGPPLADVGRRVYIAGVVTNTPDNMVRWIVDPPSIDPQTAMPVTGISVAEARDVAAYLYSLR
jgi:cytochrome c1